MMVLSLVLTGLLGGFIGGLLGLGGGIIFVPFLFFIFHYFDMSISTTIQSAIVTSLACVILSSASAVIKHQKNGLIEWSVFGKTAPGIIIGSSLGLISLSLFSSGLARLVYSLLLICIAIYMIKKRTVTKKHDFGSLQYVNSFSITVGLVSSFLGIGGGTLTTPYFHYHGYEMKKCIATASICGFCISFFGIVISGIMTSVAGIFNYNILNFLILDAFIIISLSSMVSSYYGASLTAKIKTGHLRLIFGYTLIIISIFIIIY